MLYSNNPVSYNKSTIDRRTYSSTTPTYITEGNLKDRIEKFQDQLKNEYFYRILLQYFVDIGKINFPLRIGFKIKCHLETEMRSSLSLQKG